MIKSLTMSLHANEMAVLLQYDVNNLAVEKIRGVKTRFKKGDIITTFADEKKTIQLINGSIVRLFPNSTLEIVKFEEFNSLQRFFDIVLFLHKGAAVFYNHSNMARGTVKSENVTISDTSNSIFSLDKRGRFTSVTVSLGSPILANKIYSYRVKGGETVEKIGFITDFKSDITTADKYILTKADKGLIYVEKNFSTVVGFSGEVIDPILYESLNMSFPVLFLSSLISSNKYRNLTLNSNGYEFVDVFLSKETAFYENTEKLYFIYVPDDPDYLRIPGKAQYLRIIEKE